MGDGHWIWVEALRQTLSRQRSGPSVGDGRTEEGAGVMPISARPASCFKRSMIVSTFRKSVRACAGVLQQGEPGKRWPQLHR